jgi:phosphonate transport system substrate-binding protein
VDIAWLGRASYFPAYQRDPRIEPFASPTISHGYFTPTVHHYQAFLLPRNDVVNDIEALRHKRVALSYPASKSGSVLPNAEFSAQVSSRFRSSSVPSSIPGRTMSRWLHYWIEK